MAAKRSCTIAALIFLLSISCGVRISLEETLVYRYSEGIQSRHQPTYEQFYLACHPSEHLRELSARLGDYEEMRRRGSVTYSSDGVEFIKISTLGRGGFFQVSERRLSGDRLQFKTLVKPEYGSINYTDFPPGAIVYVMAEPFGSVLPLRTGRNQGPQRRVLYSVDLVWKWKKHGAAPLGWCLESVQPLVETATYHVVQFREALQDSSTGRTSPP